MRSCAPSNTVSATGQGLKARTCRSISPAARFQSMRASALPIFRATAPVLVLSARRSVEDKVAALSGARTNVFEMLLYGTLSLLVGG